MKMVGLVMAALVALGASAQRADTVLSDGWTANGVAVTLPHTWNAVDAADGPAAEEPDRSGSVQGAGYLRQAVTYRHALPAADKSLRRFVRCEAASITAAVVVNGRVVGRHSGAMTAFAFEITKELRATNNVLEIVVDNYYDPDSTPRSGDFSMPGGLYRPVHLIETPAICFDPAGEGSGPGLEIAADPATGRVCVKPQVSYAAGTETNAVRLAYEVVETGFKTTESSFAVRDFPLWTPETPVVYHLRATLASACGTDTVTLPFGFARHELRADGYYLNGRKRKLRGVNFHQDVAGKGWAISPADERQSVEMVKRIGADAVRTAHYPHSSRVYDLCDTRGLVAWIELPVVDEVGTNAAFRAHARQNLVEMIAQNRHHPSAAFWSIANEVQVSRTEGGEPALLSVLEELRDTALAADATRPVVQANFKPGQTNVNALTGHFGLNTYPGWYWSTADGLQRDLDGFFTKNPKLTTIAVSEYGAGASIAQHENPAPIKCRDPDGEWHPEEYQTLHHVLQYAVIRRDPRIWGSFVWQMFDSAADVRTDGPVKGINDKGLVCRDHRTPKDAFFFYKANWNPEPMLHLCGRRMTSTTNAVVEVVAFSNAGDVTLAVNGKVVGTKTPDEVKTVRWQGVALVPGENRIEVTAGGRKESCRWTLGPVAGAVKPHYAFSTLRLPATRENWAAQRAMLSRSRDWFDVIWFSAGYFKSREENAEKAKWLGEIAREVREMGYVASLEFELTIGNEDSPECKRLPFKDWTGFTGPEGWEGVNCNCPRDPRFHAYFREQLRHYCAWKPTVVWLDDDVRVDNHGYNSSGCFCARCLAAFAKAEGREWTREGLVAAMRKDAALAARWRDHCFRGLGEFAFAFCRAVKEFSPTSRVGLQYPWADEGQLRIVEAMVKAVGGPIEMRPGCCSYCDRDPFAQVDKTYRMQCQVKTLLAHPDWYCRLCPEIETYPRTFTTRTSRSLGFEALAHLASGLDSLTWYIAGNAEKPELYEGTTFRAPRENLALYREYVRRNAGAVQVGFGAPEGERFEQDLKGFAAVNGSSAIPYAFGAGRKLGTVLWREDQVADADAASLKRMLSGAVLATRTAASALVARGLVPSEAANLPKEKYSDSTAYFPKSVKTAEGGRLVVYPSLDPMGATVKTLLEYAHLADEACGGRFPVLFEDPALAVVLPRVFADGSFASAVIVNTRVEEQAPVRLRLRGFGSEAALWFPLWSGSPMRLTVERDATTGDALVTLPAVGAWSGGFLAPEGQAVPMADTMR